MATSKIPTQQVLIRVSEELKALGQMSESLQGDVGELLGMIPVTDLPDVGKLQSMDLLSQSVANLATLVEALSGQVSSGDEVNTDAILQDVTLLDLAHRIKDGRSSETEMAITQPEDCDFF